MENDERRKRKPTTAASKDEQHQPKTATNNHSFSEMVAG
jgi:hypothetical protein